MTHDELLAKIYQSLPMFDSNNPVLWSAYNEYLKALRAVVERHFPYREDDWQEGYFECNECTWDSGIEYPCNTIQDITKELQ